MSDIKTTTLTVQWTGDNDRYDEVLEAVFALGLDIIDERHD